VKARAQPNPATSPPVTSELLKEGDVLVTSVGSRAMVLSLCWSNQQRGVHLERAGVTFGWDCFMPLGQVEEYLRAGLWKNTRTAGWKGRKP
jgi:hypothetical protein